MKANANAIRPCYPSTAKMESSGRDRRRGGCAHAHQVVELSHTPQLYRKDYSADAPTLYRGVMTAHVPGITMVPFLHYVEVWSAKRLRLRPFPKGMDARRRREFQDATLSPHTPLHLGDAAAARRTRTGVKQHGDSLRVLR